MNSRTAISDGCQRSISEEANVALRTSLAEGRRHIAALAGRRAGCGWRCWRREAEPEEDGTGGGLDFQDCYAISSQSRKNCISPARPSVSIEQSPVSRAMRDLSASLA